MIYLYVFGGLDIVAVLALTHQFTYQEPFRYANELFAGDKSPQGPLIDYVCHIDHANNGSLTIRNHLGSVSINY